MQQRRSASGHSPIAETTILECPPVVQNAERKMSFPANTTAGTQKAKSSRRRRSSSLMYQEPPESLEQQSDQAILPNLNAQWVNSKGAWAIHPILIIFLRILFSLPPRSIISPETSWTLTNVTYMFATYLMFHYVRGIPFEFNAGAYDNLNMWEQIDNEDQYTPAKKFLLAVPVVLFLISTHYTHYTAMHFGVNCLATIAVVLPKLPWFHRLRFALPWPLGSSVVGDEKDD